MRENAQQIVPMRNGSYRAGFNEPPTEPGIHPGYVAMLEARNAQLQRLIDQSRASR